MKAFAIVSIIIASFGILGSTSKLIRGGESTC